MEKIKYEEKEDNKVRWQLVEILNNFQLQYPYDQLTRVVKKDFLEEKKFPPVNFLKEKNVELWTWWQCLELCVLLKEELKNNWIDSKIIPTNKKFVWHQSRFNNHSWMIVFADWKEYLMEVWTSNPKVVEIPKKINEINSEKYEAILWRPSEIKITNKWDWLILVEINWQFWEPFIFELDSKKEVKEDLYWEFLHKSLMKNQSMFILTQYVRDKIWFYCDWFLITNTDDFDQRKENKLKEIVWKTKNWNYEKHKELLLNWINMFNKFNWIK